MAVSWLFRARESVVGTTGNAREFTRAAGRSSRILRGSPRCCGWCGPDRPGEVSGDNPHATRCNLILDYVGSRYYFNIREYVGADSLLSILAAACLSRGIQPSVRLEPPP
jgi:hypothetical protein